MANYIRCGVCETDAETLVRTCSYRNVAMRLFYVQCPRVNMLCSTFSKAYLPSVTVCRQRLW